MARFSGSAWNNYLFGSLIAFVFTLLVVGLSFIIFYILAKNKLIAFTKSIAISLLIGVLLGSCLVRIISIVSDLLTGLPGTEMMLPFLTSSLSIGIAQCFFPALTGLLLVKLKGQQKDNILVETTS